MSGYVEEENFKSPAEIPYFDGDYWPGYYEDTLEELGRQQTQCSGDNDKQKNMLVVSVLILIGRIGMFDTVCFT